MNKTAIKNFAIWARNKLIADVRYQAGLIGITENGISNKLPQSVGMTEFYDIGTDTPYQITGDAIQQRDSLVRLLNSKTKESNYKTAYKYILEEVAYSWFNRLIAIRFMEVNDYLPGHIRVLSSGSDGKLEPDIVSDPFNSDLSFNQTEVSSITEMKKNNDLDGLFKILFVKTCNSLNSILPGLFEETSDYTELLLNLSVVDKDGVVSRLVHDIPEEDFNINRGGQVEIIGWLYQYYNTEPKNEAFAKNGKTTKEEIPAVTQLFTPDWIVRYMVENSLGRLWLDGHPNSELKANWKYYLDEYEQEQEVQAQLDKIHEEHAKLSPEDIKLIDPCMGSGHILVYAFDVLMQIYESVGYNKRDAAVKILENNIYGLDIDDRAYQLAYFAVMMKARQYNRRILSAETPCHVYSIHESDGINRDHLNHLGAEIEGNTKVETKEQLTYLIDTFIDAKEYGSILNVDECDWTKLREFIDSIGSSEQISFGAVGVNETQKALHQLVDIGEVMARQYEIVVTNPPYMTSGNMDSSLTGFLKDKYPESKADMCAVFMEKGDSLLKPNGYLAMITMQSWMFLGSFELFRKKLLENHTITSLLHLGIKAFEEIGNDVVQTACFTIQKKRIQSYCGSYFRLLTHDREEKQNLYLNRKNLFRINQCIFFDVPGQPIAYWIGEKTFRAFVDFKSLGDVSEPKQGIATADNNRFLRLWHEVLFDKIGFGIGDGKKAEVSPYTWFPYQKGGDYRKWYGNNNYVVLWKNNGYTIKHYKGAVVRNPEYHLREGLSWTWITTGYFGARFSPQGSVFDVAGSTLFANSHLMDILAYMCSNVADYLVKIINPTINFSNGVISKLPITLELPSKVEKLANDNVNISKTDWDAFETSWDFKSHYMVGGNSMGRLIADKYNEWANKCNDRFNQLKANEEELNRIFIDIYGLQDELTPEVEDKDVTVRKAELKRDIKSLLSYAVGCMFGRYSLDVEGLAYAGGDWDDSKYQSFIPDKDNVIPITDEEYLEDDIVARLITWLKVVYGEDTLEQNLDFIANALGNKGDSSRAIIRNYCLNDFFEDHCQTYSVTGSGKRPIYWLFDSGKQNGFKALIYLHRYDADTIGNLRVDYLHRIQRIYESEISRMQDTIDNSTNNRDIAQATKRKEKLTKQLKECREYDEKIGHLALSRIKLDLDDGVKVNYKKLQTANDGMFYEVLANSKSIMVKEK